MELAIPSDRKSEFEPQLVKKHQTSLSGDIEEKTLSMYPPEHISKVYYTLVKTYRIFLLKDTPHPIADLEKAACITKTARFHQKRATLNYIQAIVNR